MSPRSKREYLEEIYLRYKRASLKEKTAILDEFCLNCDYYRKLEEATLLHRRSPSQAQRQRRRESTHALGIQGLLLPYPCYQSSIEPRERMAFLHAQSQMRTGYQRTQRKLSPRQHSYQQFFGQSGSFPFDSVGLRFGQLVQTSVSAARMELGYFAYFAQRFVCLAGSLGSHWRKKSTQAAARVSPSKTLLSDLQKNRTSQNYIDLSKTCSVHIWTAWLGRFF